MDVVTTGTDEETRRRGVASIADSHSLGCDVATTRTRITGQDIAEYAVHARGS